jgi:hypothetical protein
MLRKIYYILYEFEKLMSNDDELRKKAAKRAEEKIGFYIHFAIYIMVNIMLWSIWWINGGTGTYPWPIWATIGWGIGITAHLIGTYASSGFQDRLTEKEYEKLKNK